MLSDEQEEWTEQAIEALENDLVAYDTEGTMFGASGAGAYHLARHLIGEGWVSRA